MNNKLPPTMTIPKLPPTATLKYRRYKALKDELSDLNNRVKLLEKEKKELAESFAKAFGGDTTRRINARTILYRKIVEVKGYTKVMPPYSYTVWEEVAG